MDKKIDLNATVVGQLVTVLHPTKVRNQNLVQNLDTSHLLQ